MVIVVADTVHEFPDATRFSTEERFNNLCIWAGDDADVLVAVFADGRWEHVYGQSHDT